MVQVDAKSSSSTQQMACHSTRPPSKDAFLVLETKPQQINICAH